jgi:hypothetical protein
VTLCGETLHLIDARPAARRGFSLSRLPSLKTGRKKKC